MATDADGGNKAAGLEALHRLKSTEPPLYLTQSPELSKAARLASEYLFSAINPYAPKSPFSQLLTEGFDPEQIWQQIDLQAQPLISSLRRHVRNFEKNPEVIERHFNLVRGRGKEESVRENGKPRDNDGVESESEELEEDDDDEEEEEEEEEVEEEEEDGPSEDEEEEEEEEDKEYANGLEDKFLKIKELEEYLVEDEAREYGLKKDEKSKRKRAESEDEDEESGDEEGEENGDEGGEEDDDEFGLTGVGDDAEDEMENARYENFFGGKKTDKKRKTKNAGRSDDMDTDDEPSDHKNNQKQSLSTHEKEQEKLRSEIEEMEKANMEPKAWTMQGEVTAAKRPKNSALEVDLDFEHNVRPTPVITEEVTASLEELIQNRIREGQFDDVQKKPTLFTKAPVEKKELDENKSQKGLAELYADEYAQKTGLVSTAMSFSDEQKKEASMLFKKLCVKLDALSHFHFTPKPVIEDMSIQANVPALAMEEVAPLAVSDAAMLAPEEVFSGKGDIKDETELTKVERKRRRANKKRKFKAGSAKSTAVVRSQQNSETNKGNGNRDS